MQLWGPNTPAMQWWRKSGQREREGPVTQAGSLITTEEEPKELMWVWTHQKHISHRHICQTIQIKHKIVFIHKENVSLNSDSMSFCPLGNYSMALNGVGTRCTETLSSLLTHSMCVSSHHLPWVLSNNADTVQTSTLLSPASFPPNKSEPLHQKRLFPVLLFLLLLVHLVCFLSQTISLLKVFLSAHYNVVWWLAASIDSSVHSHLLYKGSCFQRA